MDDISKRDMTALPDLIAKLEQAAEGSRELNALVAIHGRPDLFRADDYDLEKGFVVYLNSRGEPYRKALAPDYTTSLDAAMALVRSRYFVLRGEYNKEAHSGWIAETNGAGGYLNVYATGATAALALCIAALKARSQT